MPSLCCWALSIIVSPLLSISSLWALFCLREISSQVLLPLHPGSSLLTLFLHLRPALSTSVIVTFVTTIFHWCLHCFFLMSKFYKFTNMLYLIWNSLIVSCSPFEWIKFNMHKINHHKFLHYWFLDQISSLPWISFTYQILPLFFIRCSKTDIEMRWWYGYEVDMISLILKASFIVF